MAGSAVKSRALAAVIGGIVSDAAAVPIHWIYDVSKLDAEVGGSDPEFLPDSSCPFYRIPTGKNSCYGDQLFVTLESLTESKGLFDVEDYKRRLYAKFGPDTEYEVPPGASKPQPHPWRNGSIKNFLAHYKEGKQEPLKGDSSSDGLSKVAPIVALYAGKPELEQVVRDVVMVTQDDQRAIDAAVAGAKILEKYILEGPKDGVVESLVGAFPDGLVNELKSAIELKDVKHRDVVQKFGSACSNPGTIKNCVHAIVNMGNSFVIPVREAMLGGGDNCGRLAYLGAVMAARSGFDAIPKDWISRTDCGQKALDLAEKLVSLRSE